MHKVKLQYTTSFLEKTFLAQCIDSIVARHGLNLAEIAIVVPNRRAAVFIKSIIATHTTGPMWGPAIHSQDDFIAKLSGYSVADRLTQLFSFYDVYCQQEGAEAQPFNEFVHWAPVLLADFNELDLYLAPTDDLFNWINAVKALDTWNLGRTDLTDFQKKYLQFWGKLQGFYSGLNQYLSAKGLAYQGMAYRKAAAEITTATLPYQHLYFLGFNALTSAEEQILKTLTKAKQATIFWDADSFYTQNPKHEAGIFIRRYKALFGGEFLWEQNHLTNPQKTIEIIGAQGPTAQAKLAGMLVDTIVATQGHSNNTALVLADESLLIPVLNSLPPSIDKANVTMGYPLQYTNVASFLTALFNLHYNTKKLGNTGSKRRYYYKDVLLVLNHPLFNYLGLGVNTRNADWEIKDKNLVFITDEKLSELLGVDFTELLYPQSFSKQFNAQDFVNYLVGICNRLQKNIDQSTDDTKLLVEHIYTYFTNLQRLSTLLEGRNVVADLPTLRLLFNQVLGGVTLPFFGEPLTGLQIMGMLETRTLDFENVIVLSVNEGILPQGKAGYSFIPYEAKTYFKLPTYTEKDAIYAYHFYRLLQRPSKIWLVYNSQEGDGIGAKEKSRFITQLQTELKGPTIQSHQLGIAMPGMLPKPITVPKTDDTLTKVLTIAQGKGLSPTAINTYLACKLQFYFKYVADIKEPTEVEESVEADKMGSAIHKVLENLFTPYKNQVLQPSHIEAMLAQAPAETEAAFAHYFGADQINEGQNLIGKSAGYNLITNFLAWQKAQLADDIAKGLATTLLATEGNLQGTLQVGDTIIKLYGSADRIERCGNSLRVIDYKTGIVDSGELRLKALTDITLGEYPKVVQLLMYAYLYRQNNASNNYELNPSILSLPTLSQGFMKLSLPKPYVTVDNNVLEAFEELLQQIIGQLLNPTDAFTQTPEKENCRYCVYNSICNRV